jgi:hypothetical protein
MMMIEKEMCEYIENCLNYFDNYDGEEEELIVDSTTSFENYGMMTSDKGFVVKTKDGEEFEVTVKKRSV